jgi:multidrug efflux pump subunit AcrB
MVASIETGTVPAEFHRQNGKRVVQVSATLDKTIISTSEAFEWIKNNLAPQLKASYPQLSITGAGDLEKMGELKGRMKRALVMILNLIYALLAIPLKSYWQPLVIMSVIPFGFMGAAIGHWVMGGTAQHALFFRHAGRNGRRGQRQSCTAHTIQ